MSIEGKLTTIMAQIDDLQGEFDQLSTAVTSLLDSLPSATNELQARINQLVEDDEIENSKLAGLTSAMSTLRQTVTSFGQEAAPAVDMPEPAPLDEPTSVPPDSSGSTEPSPGPIE